jgi:site-specific DNA-cytosine methylase
MALGAIQGGASVVAVADKVGRTRRLLQANLDGIPVLDQRIKFLNYHPDVILIGDEREQWARNITLDVRPRVVCYEKKSKEDWLDGYEVSEESLGAIEFGLPQKRLRTFVVGFRSDLNPGFRHSFPFPDTEGCHITAGDLFEKNRVDLLVSPEWEEKAKAAKEKRARSGFRFNSHFVSPDGVWPAITPRCGKDRSGIIVESPEGRRFMSRVEAKRVMGFPDDWRIPSAQQDIYALLGADVCPPVMRAIMDEIRVWLF